MKKFKKTYIEITNRCNLTCNICQPTLPEILAAPRAAAIREGFAHRRILHPICRRFTYRQRFQHNIPLRTVPGMVRNAYRNIQ